MELLLKYPVRVASYDVDPFGRLRLSAMMNYLQEVGRLHAREIGVTVERLHEMGKTWVTTELRIDVAHQPPVDTELTVLTWPSRRDEWEVIRDFEITASSGELVAAASASYLFIDLATRRPTRLSELVPAEFCLDRKAIADKRPPMSKLDRVDHEVRIPVMLRDLDVNWHVNNIVYAQWSLEAVPMEIWRERRLESFEIAYRAEALQGDSVAVKLAIDQIETGLQLRHEISSSSRGIEVARVRTRWT